MRTYDPWRSMYGDVHIQAGSFDADVTKHSKGMQSKHLGMLSVGARQAVKKLQTENSPSLQIRIKEGNADDVHMALYLNGVPNRDHNFRVSQLRLDSNNPKYRNYHYHHDFISKTSELLPGNRTVT